MKSPLSLLILCTVLIFTSCTSTEVADSKDVSQEQIYQKYYATWDASSNETSIETVFRFGGAKGTSLTLSEPSTIHVNGKEMNGQNKFLRGYIYSFNNMSFSTEELEFAFTTTENKRYKNSYNIKSVSLADVPDSFYQQSDLYFSIEGDALGSNEMFILEIKDSKGAEAVFSTDVVGTDRIYVEAEALKELSPGAVNIQIYRQFEADLEDAPEIGGFALIKYLSEIYTSRISYQQVSNI
jgi:hypothetical protein